MKLIIISCSVLISEDIKKNRIGASAFLGSIKCFKYLMMNGDEINEDTCRFAVAGGNNEIIHLCEQKGLQFDNCLFFLHFIIDLKSSNGSAHTLNMKKFSSCNLLKVTMSHTFILKFYQDQMLKQKIIMNVLQ